MTTRRRLDPEQRRAQLLDVAVQEFAAKPYDAVQMEQVAEHAGVSRALLYRHFPTKRDLFAAVYRRAADHLRASTGPDQDTPLIAQVTAGLDAYFDYVLAHRDTILAAHRTLAGDPVIQAVIADELAVLRQRLVDAPGLAGHARDLLSAALAGWLLFVRGLCVEWLVTPSFSRTDLRGICVGALLGALDRLPHDPLPDEPMPARTDPVGPVGLTAPRTRVQSRNDIISNDVTGMVDVLDEVKSDKRTPLRRSVTRERLLAAAATSFLAKGFHRSSVDSIASAAGYTTGAIYSNFKDKDGLFIAVSRDRFQRFYAARYRELERARTTTDIAAIMAKIAAEQDETYYLWGVASFEFAAYSMRNPTVRERLRDSIRATLTWMEQAFAPVAERCGVPAPIFAQVVTAVVDGSAMLRLTDDSIDEPGLVTLILSRIMSSAPPRGEEL